MKKTHLIAIFFSIYLIISIVGCVILFTNNKTSIDRNEVITDSTEKASIKETTAAAATTVATTTAQQTTAQSTVAPTKATAAATKATETTTAATKPAETTAAPTKAPETTAATTKPTEAKTEAPTEAHYDTPYEFAGGICNNPSGNYTYTITNAYYVYMHSSPDGNSATYGISGGETGNVISVGEYYTYIEYNGHKGYVYNKYLLLK